MSPYNLLNRALRAKKNVIKEIVKVRDVLYLGDDNYEWGMQGPSTHFNPQKAPIPLFFWRGGCWRVVCTTCCMVGREAMQKKKVRMS